MGDYEFRALAGSIYIRRTNHEYLGERPEEYLFTFQLPACVTGKRASLCSTVDDVGSFAIDLRR